MNIENLSWLIRNIIWVIIGVSSTYVYKHIFSILPNRKLWKLSHNAPIYFITANTPKSTRIDQNEFALTGYVTEFVGSSLLSSKLGKLFKNTSSFIGMEDYTNWGEISKNDIVLFGGPVNNPLTKKVLEDYRDFIPYYFNEYSLCMKNESVCYESIISDDNIQMDYALVINTKSPYQSDKRVILIAGCRTMGCLGGAIFMNQDKAHKIVKKLNKKIHKHNSYALVIKVKSHKFNIMGTPTLVSAVTFDVD